MHVQLAQDFTDPAGNTYPAGEIIEVNETTGLYLIYSEGAVVILPDPDPPYVVDWKYENEKWERIHGIQLH